MSLTNRYFEGTVQISSLLISKGLILEGFWSMLGVKITYNRLRTLAFINFQKQSVLQLMYNLPMCLIKSNIN